VISPQKIPIKEYDQEAKISAHVPRTNRHLKPRIEEGPLRKLMAKGIADVP
jgi:hypothetical protein